jgi:hypothetical protein
MSFRRRLLIWGTTYPDFSRNYFETVCTGAVDAETRRLVRIYPVTLRYMKEPFRQYDWIEADVTSRHDKDPRPESYRIDQGTIQKVGHLDTNDGWAERSKWILGPTNVFRSVEALQAAQAEDGTSLGLVKPKSIIRVFVERKSNAERQEWEQQRQRALDQQELFADADSEKKSLSYMPIRFKVRFTCDDPKCIGEHDFSILDWGTYVLGRKQFADRDAAAANRAVVDQVMKVMDPAKRDSYFFLGNTKAHPRNFMVVGFYYPPLAKTEEKGRGQQRLL